MKKKSRKIHLNQTQFDKTEIYRQLRTNIEFSSFQKDLKVICVTSANPGEGKSSVARNLAIIFAAKYEKVLLLDCDLRRPSQHKSLKTTNAFGISNLTKDIENIKVLDEQYFKRYKDEEMEGKLYFLAAGSKVPNPLELLSSDKFKQLMDKLKEEFDYIIIDSPPLLRVADAIPLSNISDGTILTVSSMETNKEDVQLALSQLQRNGANVLGSVLTKVEFEGSNKYKYHYGNY